MFLSRAAYLCSTLTGDSADRNARRETLRKKPRSKVVRETSPSSRGHSDRRPARGRGRKQPEIDAVEMEGEQVPIENFEKMKLKNWREVRKLNPYRFPEPTCDADERFWTCTQFKMWNEFYMTLKDKVVKSKQLDEEYLNEHKEGHLVHIMTLSRR